MCSGINSRVAWQRITNMSQEHQADVRLLDLENEGTVLLRNVEQGVIYHKTRIFIVRAVKTSNLYSLMQFLNISMVRRKPYFIHI